MPSPRNKRSGWATYNAYHANDSYVIAMDSGSSLEMLDSLNERTQRSLIQALNKAADRARTSSDRAIRTQIAFPASYLRPSEGRLEVTAYASGNNLQAVITARTRPTSLARFARRSSPGQDHQGKDAGVAVTVSTGHSTFMKRAFVMRLRAGQADLETKSNLGLAIRLRPGETIRNKRISVERMKNGLYLLYGPSVSQVFSTVREDITPEIGDFLEREFTRLLDLKQ